MRLIPEPTNTERARRARQALVYYLTLLGKYRTVPEAYEQADWPDFEEALTDLLADLHHFLSTELEHGDEFPMECFERLANTARSHYEAELNLEEPVAVTGGEADAEVRT